MVSENLSLTQDLKTVNVLQVQFCKSFENLYISQYCTPDVYMACRAVGNYWDVVWAECQKSCLHYTFTKPDRMWISTIWIKSTLDKFTSHLHYIIAEMHTRGSVEACHVTVAIMATVLLGTVMPFLLRFWVLHRKYLRDRERRERLRLMAKEIRERKFALQRKRFRR